MPWTATVSKKEIINGVYHVTLSFSDGTTVVNETHRSTLPDAKWIPDLVAVRIKHLESLYGFNIAVGPVTPTPDPVPDPDRLLFLRRCSALRTVETLINLGIVSATNPKVVQLGNWIKSNFDKYLTDLES